MHRRHRGGWSTLALVVTVTAAGCGEHREPAPGDPAPADLLAGGEAPAEPYDGPLHVPFEEADEGVADTPAGMETESGAAGMALECDGEMYSGGGGGGGWSEGDGGATPLEGLLLYFEMEQPQAPGRGYRIEREEEDRVLFSYDVDGRTKVAVIVAHDRPNAPGWGPETSAACDPAELPESFTDQLPAEIWTDAHGDRVPSTVVSSWVGTDHCDWGAAHFLATGRDADATLYARDPEGVLPPEMLTGAFDAEADLPPGARDTGYRLDDWALWLAEDEGAAAAFVVTPDGTELWPGVREGWACA
jgi:hypothetical protein